MREKPPVLEIPDGPTPSAVVELDGPFDVAPLSPAEMRALAAFERREDLARSSPGRRLRGRLAALTRALAFCPASRAPRPTPHAFLRVVSWNIERGTRLRGIKALLTGHELLRDADILMLNEVDRGMARSGNVDVCTELARHLDLHLVFGNGYLALAPHRCPDGPAYNRIGMHGNAVLSRHPLRAAECFTVPISSDRFGCPDRRLGHKKALCVAVDTPLGPLHVVSVHLDSNTSPAMRGWQMRGVLRHLQRRGLCGPLVLAGDLNTSTIDFDSLTGMALDLGRKLARGGPHGIIHHCRHPEVRHERPLFDALRAAGLSFRAENPPGQETCRFEVDELEDACAVMSFPPAPVIRLAGHYLRTLGGVAPFKLDWFATRHVTPLRHATGPLPPGWDGPTESRPGSVHPTVIPRPTHEGRRVSDHDPILLDLVPAVCDRTPVDRGP